MKKTTIAGIKVNPEKLPTREQMIKAALFTGKLKEEDIITEIDNHELYRVVPERTGESETVDTAESERFDTVKRSKHNKPGKK